MACCGCNNLHERESNNYISKANTVKIGEVFSHRIYPLGDVDWFKVQIPEQGYLRIVSVSSPSDVEIEVMFAQATDLRKNKFKQLRSWMELPDACFCRVKGNIYFSLKDQWDDGASPDISEIKVEFIPEVDITEPNNDYTEAFPVSFGNTFDVSIFPLKDGDWFSFQADSQGYVEILIPSKVSKVQPEARFYKKNEFDKLQEIGLWKELPGGFAIEQPGQYYVYVHDTWEDDCCENPFQLIMNFIGEMDCYECNNSFDKSKEIKENDTVLMAIYPKSDHDFYKIIPGKSFLNLSLLDETGLNLEVKLYSADKSGFGNFIEETNWQFFPARLQVNPGDTYFLHIHDNMDDDASKIPFRMLVR